VPVSQRGGLDAAIAASLDGLLAALALDGDEFPAAPTQLFDRIYGGQLLAQALVAAGSTVDGRQVGSLHASFVKAGAPGSPISVDVVRVRDGRSVAVRQVHLRQGDETLLLALVTFHDTDGDADVAPPPPPVDPPASTPVLQDWVQPLDIRMGEAPTFLGGGGTTPARSHWMRAPRDVGDDPLLHAALLAYGSDFFLMDMVFRAHPSLLGPGRANGFSLDHALWFHRPVRFDEWHLHTQEAVALVGDRGLARGAVHDQDGRLVASVMQEVLVRPLPAR
jgi:acyl-CoA thioesterase-2